MGEMRLDELNGSGLLVCDVMDLFIVMDLIMGRMGSIVLRAIDGFILVLIF